MPSQLNKPGLVHMVELKTHDFDTIEQLHHHGSSDVKLAEVYNNFHALIVINAKEHCQKKLICDDCPLGGAYRRNDI
jgi:endonuclease III-like uncharacterized protein